MQGGIHQSSMQVRPVLGQVVGLYISRRECTSACVRCEWSLFAITQMRTTNTYELQCKSQEPSIQDSHTRSLEDGFYRTLKPAVMLIHYVLKVRECSFACNYLGRWQHTAVTYVRHALIHNSILWHNWSRIVIFIRKHCRNSFGTTTKFPSINPICWVIW